MAADGVCGLRGREGGRGDVVALLGGDVSFALADSLNANESGELGKAVLAWEAAIGGHPAHLAAHTDPACLDAAVSLIDLLSNIEAASSGMGERARDLGQQVRLVLLYAQQVVGLVLDD